MGLTLTTLCWSAFTSSAQILYVGNANGTIGEYNSSNGTVINSSFITGLYEPQAIAFSSNTLYVENSENFQLGTFNGSIGAYNASTGTVINASLISGLNVPEGLAISGSNLYISTAGNFTIGDYDANTGTVISSPFTSNLSEYPVSLAISQGNLYVAVQDAPMQKPGGVGKYDATTGSTINASFIGGLTSPSALAISGSDLYIADLQDGSVAEFNAFTGIATNSSFISGLHDPTSLALYDGHLYVAYQMKTQSGGFYPTVGEFDATTGAVINPALIDDPNIPVCILIASVPEPTSEILILFCGAIAFVFGCSQSKQNPISRFVSCIRAAVVRVITIRHRNS